jgi:hypothetical protein
MCAVMMRQTPGSPFSERLDVPEFDSRPCPI